MSTNTILATTPLVSTNYLLRATGTTIGNSLIQDDGSTVTINATSQNVMNINSTNATGVYTTYKYNTSTSVGYIGNGVGVATGGAATDFGFQSANNMIFATGGSAAIRMTITSAGNVGIGTSSPRSLLEVLKTTSNTSLGVPSNASLLLSQGGNVNELSQILFGYTLNTSPAAIAYITTNAAAYTNGAITFATRDVTTDTAPTERMRITSGGNVGIGETPTSSIGWARILTLNGNNAGDTAYILKKTGSAQEIAFGTDGTNLYVDVAGAATATNNNIVFRTGGTNSSYSLSERMRITSGGNVLIGTTTNTASPEILQVYGNIQFATGGITKIVESWGLNLQGDTTHPVKVNSAALLLGTSSGSSWTAGQGYKSGGGSWADSSDIRLKENIKTVENALDKITKLRGVTFDWKDEFVGDREKSSGGFIAQEVEAIFPEFVQERGANNEEKELINCDTIKTIYLPFTFYAYMVEAIKELNQQNEELSNRLIKLESK